MSEAADGDVTVNREIRELQEKRTTPNVIAETPGGNPENVVMLGAPRLRHGRPRKRRQRLRFRRPAGGRAGVSPFGQAHSGRQAGKHGAVRLWTAEEVGLVGSEHHVAGLSEKQREQIALYLNFDMIASPNHGHVRL